MAILSLIAVIGMAALLIRLWIGILNVSSVEEQSLAVLEKKHPYLPQVSIMLIGIAITALLVLLSSFSSANHLSTILGMSPATIYRTIAVFLIIVGFGFFDQWRWKGTLDRSKYFFAFILGTIVTWILIAFKRVLLETGIEHDPFLAALGITCIVLSWRFLFGPWSAPVKATVLGTFILWTTYAILRNESYDQVIATALAAIIAFIPVVIWCRLFLCYHRERLGTVALAFFAGMLSTAPILFYDTLVKRSMELNFFVLRITPVSFSGSSDDFVRTTLSALTTGTQATVVTAIVTYLFVGILEEASKFWVLKHSTVHLLRSIDDVLQLAIIVALGFAFAENLLNPYYFVGFVRSYLITPGGPYWGPFVGNVIGRAVLTTMVHILSTGILGYFFGLSLYASPLLKERFEHGRSQAVVEALHRLLAIRRESIFTFYQLTIGMLLAIITHAFFDFTVSLPELIPGNPQTVGALLNFGSASFFSSIPLTLLPSLLYVVGGMWVLVHLFERKEDMKEFGAIIQTQTVVTESTAG